MKNLNFKSSFYEKLKLIIVPLMLVTLGVGQMWGASIFNCGIDVNDTWYKGTGTINAGNWLNDKTAFNSANLGTLTEMVLGGQYDTWDNNQTDYCSWNSNNGIWITIKKGSTQKANFKLSCYHDSFSSNNNTWKTKGGTGGCSDSGSWNTYTYDISSYAPGNDYTIKASWTSPSSQSTNATASFTIPGFTTTSTSQTFDNTNVGEESATTKISFGTHYGTALTTSNCSSLTDFTVTTIDESGVTVKFTPQTAGSKSETLTITDAHSKTCTITLSGKTQYTVSYNKGSNGTGDNTSANKVYGTNLTLLGATFTRTGYTQTAWNTDASGTGGTSYALSGTYSTEAAVTLYPTWTAKTTTVTLNGNAPGGQTVTGGGRTVTATYDAALPSFTALTCTGGYALKGYYDASTNGNKIINADGTFAANSGIWNRLDGATLTLHAQWSLDRTLTYDGNGNTSGSVPAAATSYANGTSVTVLGNTNSLAKTGYTFTGWNTQADGNGTPYSAGNTITMNANYTLFAQWSENMTTVTISANPTGMGTFTVDGVAGTSASVGVTTTKTIVATAESDFEFTSWSATNCSASPTNNKTTTLTGNGSSATGTLQATFTENVASGWYLGGTDFGNDWGTSNTAYPLSKKYRGMEGVFYRQGAVTTAAYDCLHNGTTRYRPTSNTTFQGAGWSNKISLSSTSADANYRFKTAGTYYIIADTRGATPVIWYETSEPTRFNYHTVNVTGVNDSKGTCKVRLGSTSGFETTKFANGETFYVTITGVTGWIPTITIGGTPTTWWKEQDTYTASGTMSTSDVAVTISYTNSYAVTFDKTTGCSTLVAKGPNNTAISTGNKVKSGTSITFTQTKTNDGYDFSKWYSTSTGTGGTQHGTDPSGLTKSITAATSVYPIYTKHTWSAQTLSKNDVSDYEGTSANGAFSVTYLGTSISVTTTPTRSGYSVAGYYKEAACTNMVAAANGTLQTSISGYTDGSHRWTKTTSPTTLHTKWQQTLTLAGNGAGSTDGSITMTYGSTTTASHTAATRTGYTLNGYFTATSGGNKVINKNGTLVSYSSAVSSYLKNSSGEWIYNGTPTLSAQWTANTYNITLTAGVGGSGSNGSATVQYDATALTSISYAGITQTGYHIGWWKDSSTGDKVLVADGTFCPNDVTGYITSGKWTKAADCTLEAYWVPNEYTVTLDVDEAHKGTIAGATESQTVTFNEATVTVPNRPTAEQGYALMGYFTDQLGEGIKLINGDGTWISNVTGYTDENGKWVHDGDVKLYAYYKKAEITDLVLSPTAVPNDGTTITATPTIDPSPTGDYKVCWQLQYNNGTAHPTQVFTPGAGNAVTFAAPTASGIYRVECKLYTGTVCGSGTLLDTRSATFQVAGEHTVTIQYQDADGRTIKASTEITAYPLSWSSDITAPTVVGYTFDHWAAGDGVTIKDGESSTATTHIKATYAGTLTAVYTKKNMIYFNNTLGWSDVYVYFYSTDKYWVENHISGQGCGTGSNQNYEVDGSKAYYRGYHGHMTQIEGSNIWYYDYEADWGDNDGGEIKGYDDVVFIESEQNGYNFFYNTKACRRGDFKHSLPMFVPLTTKSDTKNGTDYYSNGYWMNYPENTGYTLKIYNAWNATKTAAVREYPFPFSADKTMPLKLDVEFNDAGTHEYWFMVYRNDGEYLGNAYNFNQNYNGEQIITSGDNKSKITTSAPGIYTLTLLYKNDKKYYIDVDFPIAVGDYRIVYSDNATWSKDAHSSWYHPSDVIRKISGEATEAKTDIVSFFISKGTGITASMKFQYASAISDAGVITWTDVPSGTITIPSEVVTKAGVYNFTVSQPAGESSISIEKVEPYTGNFYIRTDCAGSTKWDSYKATDHQMTYSDYAENYSYNEASKRYTHYYCHWVTGGTNVKFCIANDYSPCISDSLIADYETVIANINGEGFLASGAANNANIRFMWNEHTNKLSRAYIGGSGSITDRFLVLEGDAKMYDAAGNALTGDYQDHDKYGNKLGTDNQVIMHDDENFVYERTIKVNASARAKLTAKYNTNVQYFKGSDGTFDESHTVQLLGGEYNADKKYSMRIVYDFKTNRLVTAYMPEGEVSDPIAINADLMLIREHQEDGQQLTFTDDGALSAVKTVYGVMRFNRWTLNNKSKTNTGTEESPVHAPVGDPKSSYERGMYWISFPFDVNLSDVFGFGTYGVDWIIEYYDGASRASKGFWKDSPGFWEFVMPEQRPTYVLEAGKGYVLALDLDRMKDNNTNFWKNNIEQIELFFPSASSSIGAIEATNVKTTIDSHACTIDRTGLNGAGADINKNRTKADSHWNMIGVPSYANYGTALTSDGSTTITWRNDPTVAALPYLYEWNMVDNTYTAQSGSTYPFKAMYAYMVQYYGDIYWSLASATPSSIVARKTYAEKPKDVEFRLELQQNDKMTDQTFVKMSNDEEVSANFVFNEDLCKEYNGSKANIYTFIENWIPAAGNILPTSEQTTVVPVGVQIKTDGEYTFAIPEGTEGVGVTLVDNETGVRTPLGLTDYAVTLTAGTYDKRFVLEISPVANTATGIEESGFRSQDLDVRKVLIDNILYIVKDGVVYDARGARVQ